MSYPLPMVDLADQYGRVARDLRISLTDRCNLRCRYCVPEKGLQYIPGEDILRDDEVIRLIRIAVNNLGITKIRFTGGEPLLRPHLEDIVAAVPRGVEVALTTNGVGLAQRAAALASAGVQRVNISLDSIRPEEYAHLTRRDRLRDVVKGIRAAWNAGLRPVKINAVMMPQLAGESASELVAFALSEHTSVRFIEFMPLGPRGEWHRDTVVTSEDMLGHLRKSFKLTPASSSQRGSAPAALWNVAAGTYHGLDYPAGQIGFISSVSEPFCSACDRTRLTADGAIRSCLFSTTETDVRSLLRRGASDAEIAHAWSTAMWAKPESHGIMDAESFELPSRMMSAIGG